VKDLKKNGLKYLILDFDGVLAEHNGIKLNKQIKVWVKQSINLLGKNRIFILSNNKSKHQERSAYYKKNYPDIIFVDNLYSKPYPYDVYKIFKKYKIKNEEYKNILLIDDRLFTGILLSMIIGIKSMYLKKPIINWKYNFLRESYIFFIRKIEILVCKLFILL